ncbi:hypothetical protein ACFWVB_02650 [Streptomyces microflavus]|uniref:hypothetical protein n=1 Tax=Streptomyces microflavus TaxID=1919 RepID=UPI00366400B1
MTALVTRDPRTGLRRGPIRWPDGTPPPPYGCRRCGNDPDIHGAAGHRWQQPTSAQFTARMKARRKARDAARAQAAEETARQRAAFQSIAAAARSTAETCDAMNHDSVGNERFCQLDVGHPPDEDHDAGEGTTWPVEY